ncbi:hypothetical protein predicted by Glimmer/Critica [Sorangium cellulosum So ce56]|uniref:Uncharacterized protein n=1 Tax=Sorangium cellulosum (strain So ce56) TaxID=448385 RepID=A9GK27_SORC5|nr:hypothetical protein [Sorangium cellulosum]CAN96522.1 hypothetical protein predicted by Glimmer/Critica [Sorangium cellulosum So ce56]
MNVTYPALNRLHAQPEIHRVEILARRAALAAILLAAAACGEIEDRSCPGDDPECSRVAMPLIQFTVPTIQCIDGSSDAVIEFSSSNGYASYQPAADQWVKIMDASGALVPPYLSPGDPYITPVYTSPPLTLTPGAIYTVEIVTGTGVHAYPGVDPDFPYTNVPLTAPACAPDSGKGMTWGKYATDPITGVLQVGCQPGGSFDCDPFHGDTSCSTPLPVLCKNPLALPEPATFTVSPDATHVWSGNVVATTPAVAPAAAGLNSRAAVNAYCAAEFGAGWEVAEFHDGSGWNFTAYGNVGTAPRFWVDINDQPDGTCW